MTQEEKIEEYIIINEIWKYPEIVCPYCNHIHDNQDPAFMYTEREDEEFECEHCGRKFLLTAGYDFWYTSTPLKEEIVEILKGEEE